MSNRTRDPIADAIDGPNHRADCEFLRGQDCNCGWRAPAVVVALPPTLPAPASVALLDQEDLDEMAGHLANLDGIDEKLGTIAYSAKKQMDEAIAMRRVIEGIAKRVRVLLAERAEATK